MKRLAFALAFALLPSIGWAQLGSGSNAFYGGGTVTDKSGTTTGASVTVMPANPKRVYCEIQPVGGGDIWVAIDATAAISTAGTFWIPSGSLFRCPLNFAPTGNINVIGTSGVKYTASEYAR